MTGHERDETGTSVPRGALDAPLERGWREASDEQPPAALDAVIIAAARESLSRAGKVRNDRVDARPRPSPSYRRWQPLAVAASVAGLALVLVQMLPREPDLAPPGLGKPESGSSGYVAAGPGEPQSGAEALSRKAASAEGGSAAPPRASQRDVRDVPAPADEATPAAELSVTASASDRADVQDMAAAPAANARESAGAAPRADPGAWSARISALHAAGDLDGAATSLRSFRAAFERADDFLPPSLRDWARTVE